MKFLSALILCLAIFAGAVFAEVINGRTYIPLASWARANGFGSFTQNRGGLIFFTNKTTQLMFDVDATEANLNGVKVRLGYPVAKGGLIAQFDIDNTIRPLVFAQKPAAKKITTIILDPGHGGKDTGNHIGGGLSARNEKTYTLALAKELRDQLKKAGFNVWLTRTNDTFVELPARPAFANRKRADLFISLHFNGTESAKAEVSGAETYCITPVGAASSNAQGEGAGHSATAANAVEKKSLLLAYQVQQALVKNLDVEDRSVRRARFAVLRDAEMPAILVESGYMSHPAEGKKIFSESYRKQIAAALVKGIVNYQKLTAPPAEPSPTTNKFSSPQKAK